MSDTRTCSFSTATGPSVLPPGFGLGVLRFQEWPKTFALRTTWRRIGCWPPGVGTKGQSESLLAKENCE